MARRSLVSPFASHLYSPEHPRAKSGATALHHTPNTPLDASPLLPEGRQSAHNSSNPPAAATRPQPAAWSSTLHTADPEPFVLPSVAVLVARPLRRSHAGRRSARRPTNSPSTLSHSARDGSPGSPDASGTAAVPALAVGAAGAHGGSCPSRSFLRNWPCQRSRPRSRPPRHKGPAEAVYHQPDTAGLLLPRLLFPGLSSPPCDVRRRSSAWGTGSSPASSAAAPLRVQRRPWRT